ncbi:hypothetical protein M8J77_023170 [Diaphorina citri]|nr:hypothetical protein M8J77_023170 [Diaphorina citri]
MVCVVACKMPIPYSPGPGPSASQAKVSNSNFFFAKRRSSSEKKSKKKEWKNKNEKRRRRRRNKKKQKKKKEEEEEEEKEKTKENVRNHRRKRLDRWDYRNLVHNLSVSDLSERQVLQWYSTDDNTRMCALKGKDEDACQNYIRILSKMDNNRLLVCGTNSFKPLCREYEIKTREETEKRHKKRQSKE